MLYFQSKQSDRDLPFEAVNRGMRVKLPREAVTVRRGESPRSQKTCPCGANCAVLYREPRHPAGLKICAKASGAFCAVLSFSLYNFRKKERRGFFMSKNTKKIIAVIALLVLVAAAVFAVLHFAPSASEGDKTIAVAVIHGDGSRKDFSISTDAENLRAALEPEGLIQGQESEFGLYVLTVDGETADEDLQQWWCITKSGGQLMTGVDDTVIADGEQYEFTLTTGW